jgi:tellurite resistance protein TerC
VVPPLQSGYGPPALGTPVLWASFLAGVLVMIAIDLRVSAGKAITPKKAAAWTAVWVTLSLAFAGYLHWRGGAKV